MKCLSWLRSFPCLLLVLLALGHSPMARAQAQVTGDWLGTMDVRGMHIRIALHIVAAKDGTLSATMDSLDQRAMGIPVTAFSLKKSHLVFSSDSAGIHYEGTVNADATVIEGTLVQGDGIPLNFHRQISPGGPAAWAGIDGIWLGSIDTGALKLRIVFKIANHADGLSAEMQSPDQSSAWIPATSITRNDAAVTVAVKNLGVEYNGRVAADLSAIDGTFIQAGNSIPLSLKRVQDESALAVKRPQDPIKPYPYGEEDVTYSNKAASDTLAATLTIPSGKGPFPAVLLIAGTGPHDRDESLLGHKPFLVLSDYLTRKGIVVLRADKRGVGKSTGDYATATTADFAADAEAGIAYLKTRAEVDPHKIGLLGHSEGGIIAPMAAVADPGVAFIVMLAGSGVPGDQVIVEQLRLIEIAGGETPEKAEADAEKERETLNAVETEKDPKALERLLTVKLSAEGAPDAQVAAQVKAVTSPWFRFFITYDPAVALRKLTIPVLALNGSLDLQVPPAQNLPAIRKALAEGHNLHAEVDELPGLNHLFQDAKTGSPAEYGQIEETMSPLAMDKIAAWILRQ